VTAAQKADVAFVDARSDPSAAGEMCRFFTTATNGAGEAVAGYGAVEFPPRRVALSFGAPSRNTLDMFSGPPRCFRQCIRADSTRSKTRRIQKCSFAGPIAICGYEALRK
jgi:hypothetical protein